MSLLNRSVVEYACIEVDQELDLKDIIQEIRRTYRHTVCFDFHGVTVTVYIGTQPKVTERSRKDECGPVPPKTVWLICRDGKVVTAE